MDQSNSKDKCALFLTEQEMQLVIGSLLDTRATIKEEMNSVIKSEIAEKEIQRLDYLMNNLIQYMNNKWWAKRMEIVKDGI